jgi:hypothetical protein
MTDLSHGCNVEACRCPKYERHMKLSGSPRKEHDIIGQTSQENVVALVTPAPSLYHSRCC